LASRTNFSYGYNRNRHRLDQNKEFNLATTFGRTYLLSRRHSGL